jgi:hypothetical protein
MTNGGMFVEERKMRILERIERQRKATVAELCGQFHVSSAIIRSDLRDLETAGLLIRTHGGAMVKSKTGLELARLLGRRRDLTVVTNDLAIALCLESTETVRVLFMGGLVRRNYHCTNAHGSAGGTRPRGTQRGQGVHGLQQLQRGEWRTSFALFAPLEAIETIVIDTVGAEDRARLEENGGSVSS